MERAGEARSMAKERQMGIGSSRRRRNESSGSLEQNYRRDIQEANHQSEAIWEEVAVRTSRGAAEQSRKGHRRRGSSQRTGEIASHGRVNHVLRRREDRDIVCESRER